MIHQPNRSDSLKIKKYISTDINDETNSKFTHVDDI